MRADVSKRNIAAMSTDQRIKTACDKADQIWKYVLELIQNHANNKIITYSDILSNQIRPSQAAHAFNDFQNVMYLGELVRLCAIWDKLDLEKCSVPTLLTLVDDRRVILRLYKEHIAHTGKKAYERVYVENPELSVAHFSFWQRHVCDIRKRF